VVATATANVVAAGHATLYSVPIIGTQDGWAGGDDGVRLHWQAGTWQTLVHPVPVALYEVRLTSATDGWAVGAQGTLLRLERYPDPVGIRTDQGAAPTPPFSTGRAWLHILRR